MAFSYNALIEYTHRLKILNNQLLCSILLWGSLSSNALAGTITEQQALNFGEFAANFTANSFLRVSPTGLVTSNGPLHVINTPQPARFILSGYPANYVLTVTITDFILDRGAGDTFLVTDISYLNPTTDLNGDALLMVGATLQIDAGKNYPDTDYSGNITINVDL